MQIDTDEVRKSTNINTDNLIHVDGCEFPVSFN